MIEVIARDCEKIHSAAERLAAGLGRPVAVMEVCGTHTMAIARSGLKSLLGEPLKLASGPGCPVCVTDQGYIDRAVELAGDKSIVIATYGDMVRVPGTVGTLGEARSAGAAVEVVYSADKAVELAIERPGKQVVFLGVGFETTTPGTALAVKRAAGAGLKNFSVLTAHKVMMPAMEALLRQPDVRIDGYLCPGHVSVILGYEAFAPLAKQYGRPCVVAGFEPGQIVTGLVEILAQLEEGRPAAMSVYPAAKAEGNQAALELLAEVFIPADAVWRGLGKIAGSGLVLAERYAEFDAARRFGLAEATAGDLPGCRCGDVICGRIEPRQCPLFGGRCTVSTPVGPCMVSGEGACAAAYKYGTHRELVRS